MRGRPIGVAYADHVPEGAKGCKRRRRGGDPSWLRAAGAAEGAGLRPRAASVTLAGFRGGLLPGPPRIPKSADAHSSPLYAVR